jgi:hypothetical protein
MVNLVAGDDTRHPLHGAAYRRPALVTMIVTKTPRNALDVTRRFKTASGRRSRPAWVGATGRDGLQRRSACSLPSDR